MDCCHGNCSHETNEVISTLRTNSYNINILLRFDKSNCLAHLPKLIQSLMSMLLSPSPSSRDIICNSLKVLLVLLIVAWCVMLSINSH